MEVKAPFVFQADSEIINSIYATDNNYIIEYNESVPPEYCIVYFSSNNIYYPNTEEVFADSIIKKNRFEWYKSRVEYGHKHLFFRDIKKQWYLTGVNAALNTPDKLAEFIRNEAQGYKLIMVGSSAGGFISVILGQLLNAERIYSFNGQFELHSQVSKPLASQMDPILYRNKNNEALLPYYDAVSFISNPASIYYFHSMYSDWDIEQNKHLGTSPVKRISFKTSNHGIPFLKSNLQVVLNLKPEALDKLSGKRIHPLTMSLKMVGVIGTLKGVTPIIRYVFTRFLADKIFHKKN